MTTHDPHERGRQASGPLPSPDPRPGRNPGYAENQPRHPGERDIPRHGEYAGKQPDPEAGGLQRPPGADPDLTGSA